MDKNLGGKIVKRIYSIFTGIDADDLKNNNRTMEALLDEFKFKTQLQSVLKNRFKITDSITTKTITDNITVKDCSGLWLRQEVEKNLVKAGSSASISKTNCLTETTRPTTT